MIDMETELQHSTNVHSEQVAPPDAKHLLPAVLILNDAENYTGYSEHPVIDATVRKVVKADISPCETLGDNGWVMLRIYFEDGVRFSASSPSIKGAKQKFAFQCRKGAKWSVLNGR